MDFLTLAKERYSCRSFRSQPIEEEKLNRILEAGRVSPTACNKQPQRLLVVRQEEGLAKVSQSAKTYGAPLAVIVCTDKDEVWVRAHDKANTIDIDASIVITSMIFQAQAEGIGSCWIASFLPEGVRRDFNIPENYAPVSILLLGYADGAAPSPERHDTARRPLEETVFYDSF